MLLFSVISAVPYGLSYDPNTTSFVLNIQAELGINTTSQAEFEAYLQDKTLLVVGGDIDLTERILLESLKAQNPLFSKLEEVDDSNKTQQKIDSGKYILVILIGGPTQNLIAKEAVSDGWFNQTQTIQDKIVLQNGKTDKFVVVSISDKQGYSEPILKREGLNYSPLNGLIPKEYIPAAATGISILLLAIISIVRTVFEFKALDIGRKGKKVGEGAWRIYGMNVTELLAIMSASLVLGVSISWQYFGPSMDFVNWLALNSFVCLIGAIIHEVTHKIFAIIFKIKIEYRFWPAGSALTLISSYLGNAFSIQGFLLEEIPHDVPKWKVGLMKLSAPLVSTVVMISFAILNFFSPSAIYQIVYSTSALWAVAEILPFNGLDGKDIKEWSHTIWFLSFLFIGISYVFVTFIL